MLCDQDEVRLVVRATVSFTSDLSTPDLRRRYTYADLQNRGNSGFHHDAVMPFDVIRVLTRVSSATCCYTLVHDYPRQKIIESNVMVDEWMMGAAQRVADSLYQSPLAASLIPPDVQSDEMSSYLVQKLCLMPVLQLSSAFQDVICASDERKNRLFESGFDQLSALAFLDFNAPLGMIGGLCIYGLEGGASIAATMWAKGIDHHKKYSKIEHAVVRITRAFIRHPLVFVVRTVPSLILVTCNNELRLRNLFGILGKKRKPDIVNDSYLREGKAALALARDLSDTPTGLVRPGLSGAARAVATPRGLDVALGRGESSDGDGEACDDDFEMNKLKIDGLTLF